MLLSDIESAADLGEHFGADLFEHEVRWFVDREWARTAEDVLYRRSKCGLRLTEAEQQRLADWLSARQPASGRAHR
jgi:glycerol-3-phosphate dehydrogenase